MTRPLKRSPAGTRVSRSSRSKRPCGEASRPPLLKRRPVEVRLGRNHLHEQLPPRSALDRIAFLHREVGAKRLVVLGERDFERLGDWSLIGSGVSLGREAPAQDAPGERLEVGQAGLTLSVLREGPLLHAFRKQALAFNVPPVENRARLFERVGGHNQPGRLDEAEPFEMVPDLSGRPPTHGPQPVSGQRYTRPTGSTRVARTR